MRGITQRLPARRRCLVAVLAVLAGLALLPSGGALAEGERRYGAHLEATTRLGTEGRSGELDLFLPVFQADRWLFFADLRGLQHEDSGLTAREGNFGIGGRWLLPEREWLGPIALGPVVLGAYGFADVRRSPSGNTFWQATLGAELWAGAMSFRVNGYLPESGEQLVGTRFVSESRGGGIERVFFRGTALRVTTTDPTVTTTELAAFERALPGFDVEWGHAIELAPRHEIWGHARFFHFAGRGDFPSLTGPALRLEYRMGELLGVQGLRFELGGEWRTDSVRGSTWTGSLRLRVPLRLPFRRAARPLPESAEARRLERMRHRMTERVVRDVDVVTQAQDLWAGVDDDLGPEVVSVTRRGGARREEDARDPASGRVLRFVHVDSTAAPGGNGSAERPFDGSDLRNTVSSADPTAVVYVHGGGPRIDIPRDVRLQTGQRLAGSGAPLALSTRVGPASLPAGATPEIHRVGNGTGIRMAADSALSGVLVSGGRDGVFVPPAADRAEIRSVTVEGSSRDGIRVSRASNVRLEDVASRNAGREGIRLDRSPGARVDGAVVRGAGRDGFVVSRSNDVEVRGLVVDAAGRDGLRVLTSLRPALRDVRIDSPVRDGAIVNRADGARIESLQIATPGRDGLRVNRSPASSVRNASVSGAARDGFRLDRSDASTIDGLSVASAARDGIRVGLSPGVVLDGLSSTSAGRDAIRLQTSDGAIARDLVVRDAGRHGLLLVRSDATLVEDLQIDRAVGRGVLSNRSDDVRLRRIHIDDVEDGVFALHSDRLRLDQARIGRASDDGLDFQGTSADVGGAGNRVDGPVGGDACETTGAALPGFALGFADGTICP